MGGKIFLSSRYLQVLVIGPISLTAMNHAMHGDQASLVVYCIQDAIVSHSDAIPIAGCGFDLETTRWSGLRLKQVNCL